MNGAFNLRMLITKVRMLGYLKATEVTINKMDHTIFASFVFVKWKIG